MMKKSLLLILGMLPFFMFAQVYNPFVTSGSIAPAPMGYTNLAGSALFTFTFGNSGTTDLQYVPSQPTVLTVSLSRGLPNASNPGAAVSGSMAGYFNWTFDSFAGALIGTQKAMIPANASGDIIIDYKPTSDSYIFSPQNGFNVNIAPPAYAGGANSQADDNTSSFTYTIAIATPVELSYFSGTQQEGYNQLNWETISEQNSKSFELYHGKTAQHLSKLATLPSLAHNNNSEQPLQYAYKHLAPQVGDNFYQLVSIDIDGTENYHKIINLPLTDQKSFWNISPNPTQDNLQVRYANGELEMVHLILSNLTGGTVYRKHLVFEGGNFIETIPTKNLAKGTYILNITNFEGYNYSEKIIKE